MTEIRRGTFLIASPEIDSGIFHRAVILICENTNSGSFGLILNKRLDLNLPEELLGLKELANTKVALLAGGPVQTNQMMLLHSSDSIPDQTLSLLDGVFLGGDLPFLQSAVSDPEGPSLRLCFGYTGWSPGQLRQELNDGAWIIAPGRPAHVFDTPHDHLWSQSLRELGGKFATISQIPEDLSLN